jgi:hypothetical protein
MSMNLRCKAVLLGLALTAAAVAFAPAAMATPVNYKFTVDVTSGPLTGTTDHGTFSYDSSSIVPGGFNSATGLLTALAFTFNGTTWNAGTANTGVLGFDGAGNLSAFAFGNNCVAGNCTVTGGTNQWFAVPGSGNFAYGTPGSNDLGFGDVSFTLANVPEPGSLGLFGFGLLLLGGVAWRRRRVTGASHH